jgi:hypothetical protein
LLGEAPPVNFTFSGAVPDVGRAEAVQVRVQGAATTMLPLFEQLTPCTEARRVQV